MKPETLSVRREDDWQGQLRNVITSADTLLSLLELRPDEVGFSAAACEDFSLKVPHAFVRRMRVGDPRDPLLLQVLARRQELLEADGFSRDPVGETGDANPVKGIIHKYHGRVLLLVSSGCAVNCRYCFRRHFPYADNQNSRTGWQEALGYISDNPAISEVILSGGDPLLAGDSYLSDLVTGLAAIPHLRRLRIHTRLPVVIPDRVTPRLLDAICRRNLQTIMVVHCNHPNEIDEPVETAFACLASRGVTLLNQAVLLAGINDNSAALAALSERLFTAGVLPYYLHMLDKVQGAAHFDVDAERARQLMAEISAVLPGYLVPRLVREVAGAESKTPVAVLY